MKRTVVVLSLLVVVASLTSAGWLLSRHVVDPSPDASFPLAASVDLARLGAATSLGLAPPAAAPEGKALGVGDAVTIDLQMDENSLANLTAQERTDQYRDWLLIAAVSKLEGSTERLNQILFDLPPVRYGFVRPAGDFEYGPTRTRAIGDGRAVALIPATKDDAIRRDYIANAADQMSKDLGGVFQTLVVFEYELGENATIATLRRAQDVSAPDVFTAAYGYHEVSVGDFSDLQNLLAAVDDITYVRHDGDKLKFGGRKLLSRNYRGIGVEHIAAVWQADRKVQAALAAFDREQQNAIDQLNERWSGRTYTTYSEKEELERQRDSELHDLEESLATRRDALKLVGGTGFSLDPHYDFAGLAADFSKFAKDYLPTPLVDKIGASLATDVIISALGKEDIVPYLKLQKEIDNIAGRVDLGATADLGAIAQHELHKVDAANHFQAARYDGDLQGTEVGMILFYTDLLAKIWSNNMLDSTPLKAIPAFFDNTHAHLAMIYRAESDKYSNSRLWFGPSDRGFQNVENGNGVRFARTATRIYNAGSDPIDPGHEVTTSAVLAGAVTWWNDHYEEVATYEQQYERLNEIMKWSIVISWLDAKSEADRLGFLANVPVNRSYKMPDWAKAQPDLKFTAWDELHFYRPGYHGTATEALHLIDSPFFKLFGDGHYIEGGVSLAAKTLFKERAALSDSLESILRRSDLDYAKIEAGGARLTTLDKTVFDLSTMGTSEAKVVAKLAPETKLRAPTAQFSTREIEHEIAASDVGQAFELKASGERVGSLSLSQTPNGLRVGWQARDLDLAQAVARQLSIAGSPAKALANDARVATYIELPGDAHFAVKLEGSDNWFELDSEGEPSIDVEDGWLGRASGENASDKRIEFRRIDVGGLQKSMDDAGTIVFSADHKGFSVVATARDGGRDVVIDLDGTKLSGWIDKDNNIHLASRDLPKDLRDHPEALAYRFGSTSWEKSIAAQPDGPVVHLGAADFGPKQGPAFEAALAKDQHRDLAMLLASDPNVAKKLLDLHLEEGLKGADEMIGAGKYVDAIQHLDHLAREFGPLPDLMLRRAILQLERDDLAGAATALRDIIKAPVRQDGLNTLLDEVGARIRLADDARRDTLANLRAMAQWAGERAAGRVQGLMRAVASDGRLQLAYQVDELPKGEAVSLDKLLEDSRRGAVIYRQDSAGLNNLDWSPGLDTTLKQMISGDLARIVKLPAGEIGEFKPAFVYDTAKEGAKPTRLLRTRDYSPPSFHGAPNSSCDSSSNNCNDTDGKDKPTPEPVYVILDKVA